jgi:hypothetical protein
MPAWRNQAAARRLGRRVLRDVPVRIRGRARTGCREEASLPLWVREIAGSSPAGPTIAATAGHMVWSVTTRGRNQVALLFHMQVVQVRVLAVDFTSSCSGARCSVAQLAERPVVTRGVPGSSPGRAACPPPWFLPRRSMPGALTATRPDSDSGGRRFEPFPGSTIRDVCWPAAGALNSGDTGSIPVPGANAGVWVTPWVS